MAYQVPFHRAEAVGRELAYVAEALRSGHIGAGGPFGTRCAEKLRADLGAQRVLMTKSCTAALELMALLLELRPGDEVILPSFAYVTTASAFALRGVKTVLADVTPHALNLDPRSVEERLSPRTRAIVALHYAGVPCAMDELTALAERSGAALVEDNAHGLYGTYRGRPLGSIGRMSAMSFHETKTFTTGEGGTLALNDPRDLERAEVLLQKGTNRASFLRGQVAKYCWVDIGSSFELSELHAAFLCAQIEEHEHIQARRRTQWERYERELSSWARSQGVRLPQVPDDCSTSHHIFWLSLPEASTRTRFLSELAARGVQSTFHFLPLNVSPMGASFGARSGDCPVAEREAERLARLPLYWGMTADEQGFVIDTIRAFEC
jgi:dTDP-4-amino-4,6-dideoxygalactose transaminase